MDELGLDRSVFSDFVSNSLESICIIDEQQEVVEWNPALEKVTGIDAITAKSNSLLDLFPDLKKCGWHQNLALALQGKSSTTIKSLKVNGVPYSASFSALQASTAPSALVILREEHINNKSRFQPLIEGSPIATAIFDVNGQVKYFNKAYGKLWNADGQKDDIKSYNILKDDHIEELGIMPFIKAAYKGYSSEIPPVQFIPSKTHFINKKELEKLRFVKGNIFPVKSRHGQLEEVVMVLSDVTYLKKAEQILTETHLKFQMLTQGIPGVIYEFSIDINAGSKFNYISDGCEDMFGIPADEVVERGSLLTDVIHPEDKESFLKSSYASDKELNVWQWEGRIIVNGKVKWIEGKSSPVKESDSTIKRYGVLLDITKKKKVEEQFKLTDERLQLALEGAEMGLWEWENKTRKTFFNKGWASKFGYQPGELEQKFQTWAKLIHPDDISAVRENLNNYINGKVDSFEAEYRLITKSGDYRWILDKGKAIERNSSGDIIKASGTYLDINDKKKSEITIKRNEQLFTQLFDNSPLGIVLLDDVHKIIQMNKGFQDIFGYTKDEIVGNKLNNIIVPKNLAQEAIDINKVSSSGNVGSLETYRLAKNGDLIPVIIYGVPVRLENKTIGIYGIYVDITERKLAEKELQIRNDELDNFVYKVSHDLRAPLSSILGLINLANHQNNEDDIREYMGIIENRVNQLDSFINDVLSHSKNLKLAITYEIIDLSEVVSKCFDDLSYLEKVNAYKKSITVTGCEFVSDSWRVHEIFRNLISNAIKYLDHHKKESFIKVAIHVTKEYAEIEVADNGIGIDTDKQDLIFNMFYRATESSEGSGIGLYIVKNAIDKLNGSITLNSTSSSGTTFKLKLPNHQ